MNRVQCSFMVGRSFELFWSSLPKAPYLMLCDNEQAECTIISNIFSLHLESSRNLIAQDPRRGNYKNDKITRCKRDNKSDSDEEIFEIRHDANVDFNWIEIQVLTVVQSF